MGEVFQTLVAENHKLHDVMYEYTISQVWLFYEKIKKHEMETFKTLAIVIANAASYATPSYDAAGAHKKSGAWRTFLSSFDWNKSIKAKDNTFGSFLNMFRQAKIMVKGSEKKGDR